MGAKVIFFLISKFQEGLTHSALVDTTTPMNSDITIQYGLPIAHKNSFAQLPKMEANETEQPSPPLHPPKVSGLLSYFDKYKSLSVSYTHLTLPTKA